jgi:nucleoside 2-deoxyribosyltransferase
MDREGADLRRRAPPAAPGDRGLTYSAAVPTVYIASPLGFSIATKGFYENEVLTRVRAAGLEPMDPWDAPGAKDELEAALQLPVSEARREALRLMNRRLGEANAACIEAADAMLAILDGVDVDSGTAAEIGFAAAARKPIVGLRLDTRQTGDNEGARVNIQVEWFIFSSGGDLVESVEQATSLLSLLVTDEQR